VPADKCVDHYLTVLVCRLLLPSTEACDKLKSFGSLKKLFKTSRYFTQEWADGTPPHMPDSVLNRLTVAVRFDGGISAYLKVSLKVC